MPANVTDICNFQRHGGGQPLLNGEVPELDQRYAVRIRWIREIVDPDSVRKQITPVRADGWVYGRRRAIEEIEGREVYVGLVDALGVHNRRIVIRTLAEYGSES